MAEKGRGYLSYLLRLWRTEGEHPAWRASLESPRTGERRNFSSIEALYAYLEGEMSALTPHPSLLQRLQGGMTMNGFFNRVRSGPAVAVVAVVALAAVIGGVFSFQAQGPTDVSNLLFPPTVTRVPTATKVPPTASKLLPPPPTRTPTATPTATPVPPPPTQTPTPHPPATPVPKKS